MLSLYTLSAPLICGSCSVNMDDNWMSPGAECRLQRLLLSTLPKVMVTVVGSYLGHQVLHRHKIGQTGQSGFAA